MVGNIYHDPKYLFFDGQIGNKLFVIIGVSPCTKFFLVVKTTSQEKIKVPQHATKCIGKGQYFFIKENYDQFPKNTWIDYMSNSFKEIAVSEFLQKTMSKQIEKKGKLGETTINAMKNCLKLSEDIPEKYIKWL